MFPENGAYLTAAYVVVAIVLGGYVVSLWRRTRS